MQAAPPGKYWRQALRLGASGCCPAQRARYTVIVRWRMFTIIENISNIQVVARAPGNEGTFAQFSRFAARNKSAGNVFETIAKENTPWPPM
jgi:hypothetical protein